MRKFVLCVATAGFVFGGLAGAQTAGAAQPTPADPYNTMPIITALDCQGTTGNMGCGPGWFWRDGWKGWACYPC